MNVHWYVRNHDIRKALHIHTVSQKKSNNFLTNTKQSQISRRSLSGKLLHYTNYYIAVTLQWQTVTYIVTVVLLH